MYSNRSLSCRHHSKTTVEILAANIKAATTLILVATRSQVCVTIFTLYDQIVWNVIVCPIWL